MSVGVSVGGEIGGELVDSLIEDEFAAVVVGLQVQKVQCDLRANFADDEISVVFVVETFIVDFVTAKA